LYYTHELTIHPCQSEFHCWLKTPGRCFQQDDMQTLLPKLEAADVIVLAGPVYVDGMSGPLKNLLDRAIPLVSPCFELRDGHCRHSRRDGRRDVHLALVANCGFWEMDNFDPLLVHIKAVCRNLSCRFAGALLRPHGPALRSRLRSDESVTEILDAAREAGRQLVEDGQMDPGTLKIVSRALLSREEYVQSVNEGLRKRLDSSTEGSTGT